MIWCVRLNRRLLEKKQRSKGQRGLAESLLAEQTSAAQRLTIWSKKIYFPNRSHELEANAYILKVVQTGVSPAELSRPRWGQRGQREDDSLCVDLQASTVKHQEVHHHLFYLPAVENRLERLDVAVLLPLPILIPTAEHLQAEWPCASR
jgi:hypothetical protein